ncbi:hypothetical protein K9L67_00560 [Candidatus Woesearchaeota archaeon]|nr:hypothetical protein [Candidatus Woesearchaeota archaeon]MCF7900698.1 hypothetical protein [Candidatus Woesearchaeota archaeon]MCF8013219.1 hypothetical protein [Candidatus Woesearchaeota archaeon]
MATFLNIGILGYFSVIFAFLLVFVLMYGLFSWVKPFGEKQVGIYAIMALAFAILSVTNTNILRMIYFLTPWFFILLFIGFIILFTLMLFGWDMKTIADRTTKTNFKTYAIVIVVVVIVFGIGNAFGQDTLNEGQGITTTDNNQIQTTTNTETIPTVTDVDPTAIPDPTNRNPKSGTPEGTATDDFGTNTLNTLVNPQVLGLILIMFIGAFAMFFLTKTNID